MGALSLLGNEHLKNAVRPLLPDTRMLQFNNIKALEQITERTACVLIEPIQAEAGIILPAPGYLEALRVRCNETGALLIFDEIQMGMGRTGKMFAFEHSSVVPDILCLAKALGGGMPLGAFISSAENMSRLTYEPELGHITTFGGHPVCCAASMAAIEVIVKNKLIEDADRKGKMFAEELIQLNGVKEIRQAGLMLGVELIDESLTDVIMHEFSLNRLIVDRFLFNPTTFRIAPPLTITDHEISRSVQLIKKCLFNAINKTKP